MKTPAHAISGLIIAAFASTILSCQTISKVAEKGAKSGVIDQNTAAAISMSSKAIGTAAEQITPQQEYYIGRAVAANILTSYKIYTGSPNLIKYVNRICNAITVNSPKPDVYNGYHVMILDSKEINAFATSGGHIFITRGLIAGTNSEEALAGVIAHEIAHIQLQHSIKAIKSSRVTQAVMVTATSVGGVTSGHDVKEVSAAFNESVGEILTTMVNSGYSKQQEFDADVKAMELLYLAGYKPSGLVDMLNELAKVQVSGSGFGKTHPTPASRLSNVKIFMLKYGTNLPDNSKYRVERYKTATGKK